jgi:hypothetical protein
LVHLQRKKWRNMQVDCGYEVEVFRALRILIAFLDYGALWLPSFRKNVWHQMHTACCYETYVSTYNATQRHNPEDTPNKSMVREIKARRWIS